MHYLFFEGIFASLTKEGDKLKGKLAFVTPQIEFDGFTKEEIQFKFREAVAVYKFHFEKNPALEMV